MNPEWTPNGVILQHPAHSECVCDCNLPPTNNVRALITDSLLSYVASNNAPLRCASAHNCAHARCSPVTSESPNGVIQTMRHCNIISQQNIQKPHASPAQSALNASSVNSVPSQSCFSHGSSVPATLSEPCVT